MHTDIDDGTGLRQLTNKDLVVYAIGKKELTQLELELTLRLEQVVEERTLVLHNMKTLPCRNCPTITRLLPPNTEGFVAELMGETAWV